MVWITGDGMMRRDVGGPGGVGGDDGDDARGGRWEIWRGN